jgi:hypothetical protein
MILNDTSVLFSYSFLFVLFPAIFSNFATIFDTVICCCCIYFAVFTDTKGGVRRPFCFLPFHLPSTALLLPFYCPSISISTEIIFVARLIVDKVMFVPVPVLVLCSMVLLCVLFFYFFLDDDARDVGISASTITRSILGFLPFLTASKYSHRLPRLICILWALYLLFQDTET